MLSSGLLFSYQGHEQRRLEWYFGVWDVVVKVVFIVIGVAVWRLMF
jgi:hypothetical protein